jgi:integrase
LPGASLSESGRAKQHQVAVEDSVRSGNAGLRVSQVASLKVCDIDSERMLLRIEQGKGRKDRFCRALAPCCGGLISIDLESSARGMILSS